MIVCNAELCNGKAGWLRRLRYLILQPSKPKISQLQNTLSVGVATNKNMGLCFNFSWIYHLSSKSSNFFFVYWSFYTIKYLRLSQLVLHVHMNVQISMVYFYLKT
jgi:hypothetical protein